ncbi:MULTISPECIES: peptidylprolyl isomerase [unclassified Prevotella]|uniref:foldase protein PrsA n=1 Tax=unclassified Prevotella TaxID=2638335 RepID=UPI000CEA53DF|nr:MULTISPECIES: peptidylprolyl isomerase [unclassified Prevotella]MCX4293522.1 peptidylprolyl isomerase [Prevotella sp.]NPD54725.1 peptidylprolyl isomerase [Prevotella sp. PTAC]GAY27814.1 peptidyl-prolyl cis-trans isomerase [Prevotella sp. MGM1]
MRKIKSLIAAALIAQSTAFAQSDPTVMTVNGQPVSRSEFEYSYNKNNTGGVIDKKTVEEYVDLFVNYKLKVAAALDARLDTLTSFKKEFAQYRDQQVRPTLITDNDVEQEARKIYTTTKESIGEQGLIRPAHIFLMLGQKAPQEDIAKAKTRIDSIYAALKAGADFGELARQLSQDPGSARNGGELPWISRNQTLKEFEDVAFKLNAGEMSEPFMSPAGYHIVLLKERKQLEPYDSLRTSIMAYIEQRKLREGIINRKLDTLATQADISKEEYMTRRADSLRAADPEMDNLIKEYHDGLLLYEISNRHVWEKAAKDEAGLKAYFKKNKSKYAWNTPRFKGMAYHVKTKDDIKAVKNSVKKIPFTDWADTLRKTFNNDSTIRIRVEKGIFKKGDNTLVDRDVFKQKVKTTPMKDYPFDATYGKILKKGPEEYTDVKGLVTADYQDMLEKEWVKELRKKYTVTVDKEVLKTVNNH